MIKKVASSFLSVVTTITLMAQGDVLLELKGNRALTVGHAKASSYSPVTLNKNSGASHPLPFMDDFSQTWIYPDLNKWEDTYTFINSNFPIDPISYGVATFDGLDETGFPYDFNDPQSHGIADYLTSCKIDLSNIADSVYLSFYYQAQGNGNQPEAKDSLQLEFYRGSDSSWVRAWSAKGEASHPFKLVMIPVDVSFHSDTFQFRFKNYATLSGSLDHWHVDYIYLDDNRSYEDTLFNDVALVTDFHNMLNEFTAMPWEHYLTDTSAFMAESMDVYYKNNFNTNYQVAYKYQVIEDNGTGPILETYPSTSSSKNVAPFSTLIEPQAVYQDPINDFYFPYDNTVQTKVFEIKNYFDLRSEFDSLLKNDTVSSFQVFGNYYAYDDGSAEKGYGVEGIGSKLANRFDIKKSDTLTSFRVYFNPVEDNLSSKSFRLMVWSNLSPETVIYQQASFYTPIYSNTNEFLTYELEKPLFLEAGTYYFGWEKISSDFLNVGWDVNTNNRSHVFINTAGSWENASFDGTLMLHPVFGNYENPPVSVGEVDLKTKPLDITVYPNPSSSHLFYEKIGGKPNTSYELQLVNAHGKAVFKTTSSRQRNNMDVSYLSNGVYFIYLTDDRATVVKKVVIHK